MSAAVRDAGRMARVGFVGGWWFAAVLGLGGCPATEQVTVGGDCGVRSATCGGDVLGSWELRSLCRTATPGVACPDATVQAEGYRATTTFDVDGGVAVDVTASGKARVHYPSSCFGVDGGFTLSCEELGRVSGIECSRTDAECVCTEPVDLVLSTVGHSVYRYQMQPGDSASFYLVAPPNDAGASQYTFTQYCVDGDTLTLDAFSNAGRVTTTYVRVLK